jgi:16S rRNA (guanine1207-N2)-methyltransferase
MHYYSEKQDSELRYNEIVVNLLGDTLKFFLASGVFSRTKVDSGSELLIKNALIKEDWSVLDLGCGNGVIGITIGKAYPKTKVTLSDINERAIGTSKKNALLNHIKVNVIKSNAYEKLNQKFDTILLNPPQTAGKDLCFKMIREAKDHLNDKGLLQIVARSKKGGKSLNNYMVEIFSNCVVTAKKGGFWVYVSKNG